VDAVGPLPVDHVAVGVEHGELAVLCQRAARADRYRFAVHAVQRLDGVDGESLDVCHYRSLGRNEENVVWLPVNLDGFEQHLLGRRVVVVGVDAAD